MTTEHNYDAGRPMSTFKPTNIVPADFPSLPLTFMLSHYYHVTICQRYRYVHTLFSDLVSLHDDASRIGGGLVGNVSDAEWERTHVLNPTPFSRYHLRTEDFVFQIRRCLDSLVQLISYACDHEDYTKESKLPFNSVGSLFNCEGTPRPDTIRIVLGDLSDFADDPTSFLPISNKLFNSIKHSLLHHASQKSWSDVPTIGTFDFQAKDFSKAPEIHNHNAYHVMMGFQDSVSRILENFRSFAAQRGGSTTPKHRSESFVG